MSTLFRLLTISLLLTANLTQPLLRLNFDHIGYNNYIKFAEDELDNIRIQVQNNHVQNKVSYDDDTIWNEKYPMYARALYQHQRKFLKAILRCIKDTKDDDFSRQFESEIYKQWKHDFKRNYKNSLSTGDWGWSHDRFYFTIHE